MQITSDRKHLWKRQHTWLSQGLTRNKSESCAKCARQHLHFFSNDTVRRMKYTLLGQQWRQGQLVTTCVSMRNLRSWTDCISSVCWLLYLPATYLHSTRIVDWSNLDSERKIILMVLVMTAFPQDKKKTCANQPQSIYSEKYCFNRKEKS